MELDRLDPRNPWTTFARAFSFSAEESNAEAVEILTELLGRQDLAPAYRGMLHLVRGNLYLFVGAGRSAVRDAEEALRLNPMDAQNYVGFAVALAVLGRIEEALPRLRQALVLSPTGQAHESLAFGLWSIGRVEQSLSHFSVRCERQRTQRVCAHYARHRLLTGDESGARRQAEEAAGLPETALGALALARFYAVLGETASAFDWLSLAVELGPRTIWYTPDAWELVTLHTEPRMLELAREALDKGEEDSRYHLQLGLVLARTGQWQESCSQMARACELESDRLECGYLVTCLRRTGEEDEESRLLEPAPTGPDRPWGYILAHFRDHPRRASPCVTRPPQSPS